MDRREFLVGSIAVVCATQLPPLNLHAYADDIKDVVDACHDRFVTDAKVHGDWMHIFEEEMERKMKQWGTYKPLENLLWNGKKIGWVTNPNFFDECHYMGYAGKEQAAGWPPLLYSDGFTSSFYMPNRNIVKLRYFHIDKRFAIEERTGVKTIHRAVL